jgi:immune inhibitor A
MDTLAVDKTACYRLWNKGKASKEYFLIENRQKTGRDGDLPGSGLALWHIDETQANNTNPLAYKVALVQADGKRELELNRNQGDPGDVFPGSKNVTAVASGMTHPHTRDNSGSATRVALSNITVTNGIVKLKVKV